MVNFDPIAEFLLEGRAYASQLAAAHFAAYGQPMIASAKTYLMRSAVIAMATDGTDDFYLQDSFLDAGRVCLVHNRTEAPYLLKSERSLPLDCPLPMDDRYGYERTDDTIFLLAYKFDGDRLTLSVAPSRQFVWENRKRYQLLAHLEQVGSWGEAFENQQLVFDQDADQRWIDLSPAARFEEADGQ